MGFCQIVYLVLLCMGLGIGLAQHGKPKSGYNNFVIDLISFGIQFSLLYFGGFFG